MARSKSSGARLCDLCGLPMRKNGTTSSGRQRWRCVDCGSGGVARREDATRMAQFRAFLAWVTGVASMESAAGMLGVGRRTFMRRTDWCWRVRPRIEPDGVVHRFVEVDGTYVPYGWCLLVAIGEDGAPIGWQWCDAENRQAYKALMRPIAPPELLVCDGSPACLKAAAELWPGTCVQRCLVHALRNTFTDLTHHPKSEAGRQLLTHAKRLTRIHDRQAAADWLVGLNDWHERHGDYIKERTMARTDPDNPKARSGRKWWWTHESLRRAYFRLVRMHHDHTLFAFLDHGDEELPRTTNKLEGGVNADLKRKLDAHRGLGEEHMRRCCEWVLYMKTADPRPERFVTSDHWHAQPARPPARHEPEPGTWTDVQLPGTGEHENGFGIRKGWAGRS